MNSEKAKQLKMMILYFILSTMHTDTVVKCYATIFTAFKIAMVTNFFEVSVTAVVTINREYIVVLYYRTNLLHV